MRDALAEGRAREGCIKRHIEEEEDHMERRFHSTLLSGNMRQAARRATEQEGGGVGWCVFSQ